MENIEKMKAGLGFGMVKTNRLYAPLLLRCVPTADYELLYVQTPEIKCHLSPKYLYYNKLWVMSGCNSAGERDFYLRTTECPMLFKVNKGGFKFVFDAAQFFQVLQYASRKNFVSFMHNCVVKNPQEINHFISLIVHHWDKLPKSKRNLGLTLVRTLEKSLERH